MATKAKVLKVLQAQGVAQWSAGFDSSGCFFFEAWLPAGLRWDNAHQTGSYYQEQDSGESMSAFWDSVLYHVDADVVPEGVS